MHRQTHVMNKEKDIFDNNPEREAPLLQSIPKSNPFIVPEGYFEDLPTRIMDACRQGDRRTLSQAADKVFWLFRPQWVLTAFVAIVCISLLLRNKDNSSTNIETIAANIPDSVIVQNLQNNIDFVDVTSLEEMTAQNPVNVMPQQPVQDTTNKEIINYLINNNVDASDIENEL